MPSSRNRVLGYFVREETLLGSKCKLGSKNISSLEMESLVTWFEKSVSDCIL